MIIDMLRSFGFWLDSIIYGLISILYQLFMLIGSAQVFREGVVDSFFRRIYVLVGIFMLFKISFSLLSMIANPEKITDKNAGLGKISTRVFISIVMLLMMPTVFKFMYDLQSQIVASNILGKVMIGTNTSEETSNIDGAEIGKMLSFTTFEAFFYRSGSEEVMDESSVPEVSSDIKETYEDAGRNNDISVLGEILNEKEDGKYIFEYKGLISTAAGLFVAYILISYCLDIGLRAVKLGFLQIMSPVPIVSYIDPKSSQDGSFNKWIKMLVMTYLDLFLRLIVIFFIVFLLGQISGVTFDIQSNLALRATAKAFIILGALMFAKQAPDLIKDLFGIKGDANAFGDLNPLKKMAKSPFVSAAVGMGVGSIAGVAGNIGASLQAGRGAGSTVRSAFGGLFTGGTRGMMAGFGDQNGNGFAAGLRAGGVGGQHILNNQGTTFLGRMGTRAQVAVGAQTRAQRFKKELEIIGNATKARENIKAIAESDKRKKTGNFFDAANALHGITNSQGNRVNFESVDQFKEAHDRAVQSGMSEAEILKRKSAWETARDLVINNDMNDATTSIGAIKAGLDRLIGENPSVFAEVGENVNIGNAEDLSKLYGALKTRENVIQNSPEYERATRTENAVNNNNNNNGGKK